MYRQIGLFCLPLLLSPLVFAQQNGGQTKSDEGNVRQRQEWLQQFFTGGDAPDPAAQLRAHEQMSASRRMAAQRAVSSNAISNSEPQWFPIGPAPSRGGFTAGGTYDRNSGRVSAIAVDPRNKDVVYVGAASGGVWKSINGGQSWQPLTDDQPSLAVGCITLDPTNPDIVYVGTGENKGNGYWGVGILKSINGGQTWTLIGQQFAVGGKFVGGIPAVGTIAISPNGSRMLAGVHNDANGGSGIYLSLDGGQTWTKKLGQGNLRPHKVLFATDTRVYAAISSQGIFASNDGGNNWVNISQNGIPLGTSRIELSASKQDANILYASIEASNGNSLMLGVFKTVNGGSSWTKLDLPDICGGQCFWDIDIAASPVNHDLVYAVGSAGLYNIARSLDGGATWSDQRTHAVHVDQQALAFSADGSRLYLGNDGGIYSTDTVAEPFMSWNNLNTDLQTTQHYRGFDMHPLDPSIMMVGSQDNGTHYWRGGADWFHATCGDGAGAVISQTNPLISFAGCQLGEIDKSETGRVGSWFVMDSRPGDFEFAQFIPLWVGDATDGDTVYYANHRLWQTRDSGASWYPITSSIAGDPMNGTTYAIAPCQANPDLVYLGSTAGGVKKILGAKSSTPGTVLSLIDASSGLGSKPTNSISVSPQDCNKLAITNGGFTGGRVWYSDSGGEAWTNITGDLPEVALYAVVMDPDIQDTFYVSTSLTVYVSRNGGTNWTPLGFGLPNAIGVDLKLHRPSRLLRLVTHGRGVWDAYLPVQYQGPHLIATPGSVHFADQDVALASHRGSRNVVITNIGNENAILSGIALPQEFVLDKRATPCPTSIPPGGSCAVVLRFDPLDQGVVQGIMKVNFNSPKSPLKIFVDGMSALGVDNDSPATAKVIANLPYRDKVNAKLATHANNDPLTGCPSSANKSVWYRYTASSTGTVRVSTIGSDYHTNISVFTGAASPFILVSCAFQPSTIDVPSNFLTFEAVSGTTYSFMISSRRTEGGSLVLSVDWPEQLDFRPVNIVFATVAGAAEQRRAFEIRNNSSSQSVAVSNLHVTSGFTVQHSCTEIPAMGKCDGFVSFIPVALPGTAQGELSFNTTLSGSLFRVPIRASMSTLTLTSVRSRNSRSSEISVTPGQTTWQTFSFNSSDGSQPYQVICETSVGLSCATPSQTINSQADGTLTFTVSLQAKPSRRAMRLNVPSRERLMLRLKDGPVIFSSPVRVTR